MKTKNLDECDEIKFLFAPAGYRCKLPLSKTSPFADISYGVQSSTNLSDTNGWVGMTNITLSLPTQIWYDSQPAVQAQRFYRVVPGPISIP